MAAIQAPLTRQMVEPDLPSRHVMKLLKTAR
jgi:hypothetical protein